MDSKGYPLRSRSHHALWFTPRLPPTRWRAAVCRTSRLEVLQSLVEVVLREGKIR